MRMILPRAIAVLAMIALFALTTLAGAPLHAKEGAERTPPEIVWHEWNEKTLAKAKAEKRHILLDLYARWCHWCHFMEQRTYTHSDVRDLVDKGYVAVKVDADANPDFASRYGDWGWPATIIFDPDGQEVAKLQGFLRPSLMTTVLYTVRERPADIPKLRPERGVQRSETTFLSDVQRQKILTRMDQSYDLEHAGWGKRLKFLQTDIVEYALERARAGDGVLKERVRASLDAAMALFDSEWGGIYQYSHKRDWSAPHYEKLVSFQAQNMRLYALAYAQLGDERYLTAARSLHGYVTKYLMSPVGAFYTSQDADVDEEMLGEAFYKLSAAERTALGKAPPVDSNLYARENGWAIFGLLTLHAVSGDEAVLDQAVRAAEWVLANRRIEGGGFAHGDADRRGPFLSDTLAMGQAMLALYMSTGEARWLTLAAEASDTIERSFKHAQAGYVTAKPVGEGAFAKPYLNIEENIQLARFANLMHRTLGPERFRAMASHAMRYLTSDAVTNENRFLLGVILADNEMGIEPAHVTVIGPAGAPAATALHAAALKLPISYKRVDRWDPASGPMPNPDITYPEMDKPAAFACANQICSLPIYEPSGLMPVLARMMKQRVVASDRPKDRQ